MCQLFASERKCVEKEVFIFAHCLRGVCPLLWLTLGSVLALQEDTVKQLLGSQSPSSPGTGKCAGQQVLVFIPLGRGQRCAMAPSESAFRSPFPLWKCPRETHVCACLVLSQPSHIMFVVDCHTKQVFWVYQWMRFYIDGGLHQVCQQKGEGFGQHAHTSLCTAVSTSASATSQLTWFQQLTQSLLLFWKMYHKLGMRNTRDRCVQHAAWGVAMVHSCNHSLFVYWRIKSILCNKTLQCFYTFDN